MTPVQDDARDLQRAFRLAMAESRPLADDPDLETIWMAARGELPREELQQVLDRVAASPACAEAWWIARRILEAEKEADRSDAASGSAAGGRRRFPSWLPMAVAASIVLAVFAVVLWSNRGGEPVYRGKPGQVESLVPDDAPLPRDDAVLRWQAGPEGTRYNLRVFREDFTLVLAAGDLGEPMFRIPEERLADVPDGETLQWQVESILPEGEHLLSEPFHVHIIDRREGSTEEGAERR